MSYGFVDSFRAGPGWHSILARVWQQLEYHIDVCRVTRGAHIENL